MKKIVLLFLIFSSLLGKAQLYSLVDSGGYTYKFNPSTNVYTMLAQVKDTVPSGFLMTLTYATNAINTLTTAISNKVNISDTANELSGYLRAAIAANTYRTQSQVRADISLTTTGINGVATYNNSTGILNIPNYTPASRIMATTTRSLNSPFQVSSTNDYNVNYSINTSVTSTLVGTNSGTVSLQISTTSGGVYTTIASSSLSISGVVSTVQNTQTLGGFVPAGYYCKIITSQSGVNGATFTYQSGQENTY